MSVGRGDIYKAQLHYHRANLELQGNKLIKNTDGIKSCGLVQAWQVVRWGWSMRFMVREDKGKESDYKSLNNRVVCQVYFRHYTNNFICIFFIPITLVRDDWFHFTDKETKPHRGKPASPGHRVSSGRGETWTHVYKTPKLLLFPTFQVHRRLRNLD